MTALQDNQPLVLRSIQRIEAREAGDTAPRALNDVSAIFRRAIASGAAKRDPTVGMTDALTPIVEGHFSTIIDPKALGGLIRAIRGYRCKGQPVVRAALELLALTFVRPGELRAMEWDEIDLDAAMWKIPAARTKMRREHLVPLAPQAVKILRELEPGHGRLVFPSIRSAERPIIAGIYDRSALLPRRTEMMIAWANYLDQLALNNERQVPSRQV